MRSSSILGGRERQSGGNEHTLVKLVCGIYKGSHSFKLGQIYPERFQDLVDFFPVCILVTTEST